MGGSIAVVEGISVGHASDGAGRTGCTALLCPEGGAAAAAAVRGWATSTRQLGIADPLHAVDRAFGVLLAGGSAFGLDAAAGVMQLLAEQGRGFPTRHGVVPVVPTAIIYDLGFSEGASRPTPDMAYAAAAAARTSRIVEGCVGVGSGATVGKLLGVAQATKGGVGTAGLRTRDGLAVGALAVVNAFGDVVDPARRLIVAGARPSPGSRKLLDTARLVASGRMPTSFGGGSNTTLAVVATNARLSGPWLHRLASWASDALACHLRPAFTAVDGDVVIALATERVPAEPHRVGLLARRALGEAVLRAVLRATPSGGLPAARDLTPRPY